MLMTEKYGIAMAEEDAGPEVELEHPSDRVDVGGVGHVGRGVVAALKRLSEVVDLHLGWGKASKAARSC